MAKLFKNWTKQEKLCAWLKSMGYEEVETRTAKYRALRKELHGVTYFIGKAGAFRKSMKGTVSDSISTTPNMAKFEAWCKEQTK